jgi:hypothetical protein
LALFSFTVPVVANTASVCSWGQFKKIERDELSELEERHSEEF